MWPWEHLAIGYLAFSAVAAVMYRRSPTNGECLLVAVGTQFPDIVDKPLAWVFSVLPSGTSLAHSVLVAVPLSVVVLALGHRSRKRGVAAAFVVGYLLHLPCDILYGPLLLGRPLSAEVLLWPLVAQSGTVTAGEFLLASQISQYVTLFVKALSRPEALPYLVFEVGLLISAVVCWTTDGRPNPLKPLVNDGLAR